MLRSPFPRPESVAVHVVDLLVDEPEIVHTGSPPFLKCALAASAAVAVNPAAQRIATAMIVRRILRLPSGLPAVNYGTRTSLPGPVHGNALPHAPHGLSEKRKLRVLEAFAQRARARDGADQDCVRRHLGA